MSDEIIVTEPEVIDATVSTEILVAEEIKPNHIGGFMGIPVEHQLYILNAENYTRAHQIVSLLNIFGNIYITSHDNETFILGCDQELEIDRTNIISKVTHGDVG
jgi:hypothetical protein